MLEDVREKAGAGPADSVVDAASDNGSDRAAAPLAGKPKPFSRRGVKIRLAENTEADFQAGMRIVRDVHARTIFSDIPVSEKKARAIFERALKDPDRFGIICAVPGDGRPEIYGFASIHAGEYFLGEGTLVATVQALVVAPELAGTLLNGKVALRLFQGVRHWAKTRNCAHLLVHATAGLEPKASDRFFRRCGMKVAGGNYWSTF